ncbi:DUF2512 family protein [Cellulosilyticum sp. I15G10I2]|uniref:DUF2512 family protein n=1 Tax=Cellulosilyticum sp. I15G10I2 TaxID=1892843 RepID=UPI00085C9664|nr:DUF2512 family protein [Cellulosilyticum sp. I15G10I2]
MKHVYALLIKFAVIAIVLELVLGFLTNLNFMAILYVALTTTLVAYVIGDLLVLPISNNTVATLVDAGLAVFIIYMYNYVWVDSVITFTSAVIAGAIVGIAEWFFHKYVYGHVLPDRRRDRI